MKHRLIIALSLFILPLLASSQVTLRGSITKIPPMTLHQVTIEAWHSDRWQQVESAFLDPGNNTFSVALSQAQQPGQYRIRVMGQAKVWTDFIVADSTMRDTALVIDLEYNQLDNWAAKVKGSPANDLYYELMRAQQKIAEIRSDSTTTDHSKADIAQAELNRRCLELGRKYYKTLIGDIAMLMYEPLQSSDPKAAGMTANAYMKAHALEKIPFNHGNILNHNLFTKRLNRYYDYFEHSADGNRDFVDGVMARRDGNEKVDGYLFLFLLDKLMDNKQDEGLSYLLKWYLPDCPDDTPIPPGSQQIIEALKRCAPGNQVADLSFNDLSGKPVTLSSVCAKNKLTFLLFWRSTCSHCQEFEPELETLYTKYHPLGLEVYALSTDRMEENWRGYLDAHPSPWVNVFVPKENRSDIAAQFPAPSTPTLIAIDKNRRVVSRVLSRGNLEHYLDEELKKH